MFAELLLGQPIFPGDSGVDQLVEIIKVLGTPTKEQIRQMNSNYTEFKFPQIKAHPWHKVRMYMYEGLEKHTKLTCLRVRDTKFNHWVSFSRSLSEAIDILHYLYSTFAAS